MAFAVKEHLCIFFKIKVYKMFVTLPEVVINSVASRKNKGKYHINSIQLKLMLFTHKHYGQNKGDKMLKNKSLL